MLKRTLLIGLISLSNSYASAQVDIELVPVVTGLPGLVDIAHAGDDRLFCVLQPGTIRIVQNGAILPTPFLNITAQVENGGNEQGLLGLTFAPDHDSTGFFYVHYTASVPGLVSRVSRFSVSATDSNVADPASEQILFTYPQPYGNHNGGEVDFGPDGYLYIGLGDGGNGNDPLNNAQNVTNPLGAILRIDVSNGEAVYEIPVENPFVNAGGDTLPEIWAYGLRNPWRFGWDALTGDLWIGDVGQNAWEEVDHWPAGATYNSGANFGWRCREGLIPTPGVSQTGCGTADAYIDPISIHANPPWCSVIGGRVYRGDQFPSLYGHYLYADYCEGEFFSLFPDDAEGWIRQSASENYDFGITVIAEGHDLEIYVGNEETGTLYRLVDPLTVGTATQPAGPNFTIYPVPAGDRFIVEGELDEVAQLQLMDQAGRIVRTIPLNDDATRSHVNVSDLANGVYVMVLIDAEGGEMHR
ncbi:MAG: PQQ-dependent sugar dehydrogenase, partial [Bacteroidota bacterium]|nr:PQQ-dependent sugar dehydrogenase [Bacteroidota bacterium]